MRCCEIGFVGAFAVSNSWLRLIAAVVLASAVTPLAIAAESYPTRALRIIVNTGAGGLVDIATRLVAQRMSEYLKQPIVVENRAGADGLIGIRFVKTAPADGYTLLASASTIAYQLAVKQDPGYDLNDFSGIGLVGRSPFLLIEATSKPDKTLIDLIARAKATADSLSYASAGVGTVTHLAAARFLQQTGLRMLHVPYKGNGPAMPDVISGRVEMIFEAYGSSRSKIKAGTLKTLGITSSTRLPDLPDVPTFTEQGVPNYTYYTWMYLLAPAGTSPEIVQRLSAALRHATATPDVRDRFREDGVETLDMSTQQLSESLVQHAADAAKLMSDLGLPKQ